MKKLILILTGVSICFVSCKKYPDAQPSDFLTETQYYNSESKLNTALAGIYQPLSSGNAYGSTLVTQLNCVTDEKYIRWDYVKTPELIYTYNAGSPTVSGLYKTLYSGVERANTLLANINLATMDEHNRAVIKGEAMFLRAYYYYLLVINFGAVPLKTEKSTDPTLLTQARTPAKDVYNFILSEMEAAIPMVKKSAELGFPGRVSQTAVKGIMARVCLSRAGVAFNKEGDSQTYYALALKWAKDVVDGQEHRLLETYDDKLTNSAYSQVFINECQDKYDVGESMWEIEFKGDGFDGKGNLGPLGSSVGITTQFAPNDIITKYGFNYNNYQVTPQLYHLYEAGDLRRNWSVAYFDYKQPSAECPIIPLIKNYAYYFPDGKNFGGQVGKWRREFELTPNKVSTGTPINFPVLRYSDVLLMLAEAENEVNGPTQLAYDAVNQVRRRAFGVPVIAAAPSSFTSIKFIQSLPVGSGTGGTGYSRLVPVTYTLTSAGGTGAVIETAVDPGNGAIRLNVQNGGRGYTSGIFSFPNPWGATAAPAWVANTNYKIDDYVSNAGKTYHVSKAGKSTTTAPTHSSGKVTLGAEFELATKAPNLNAVIGTTTIDWSGLDKDSFRAKIKDERSRELCFEGLRTYDLIRWGDYAIRMEQQRLFNVANPNGGNVNAALPYTNFSPRHLLLPIPTTEMSSNSAMVQNPGW